MSPLVNFLGEENSDPNFNACEFTECGKSFLNYDDLEELEGLKEEVK